MAELADRLGVSVPSISRLELNDERGAAKAATVDRALGALGLGRWHVVLPVEELDAIIRTAESVVDEVSWTMALEAQPLTSEAIAQMRQRLIAGAFAHR